MKRNLSNENTADAVKNTTDIVVKGNPDEWQVIVKASSESQGWMKSTKAMFCGNGVLVQVTTEHRDDNNNVSACSDALEFIPGGMIDEEPNGDLRII